MFDAVAVGDGATAGVGNATDQIVLLRPDGQGTADGQSAKVRKRQWGAEKRSEPLSIVHPAPSRRKIVLGRIGVLTTVLAWLGYVVTTVLKQLVDNPGAGFRFGAETFSYLVVVSFLTFSALMYLTARQGALTRFRAHRRVPRGELDRHFFDYSDGITVLIPSYPEDPDVLRRLEATRAPAGQITETPRNQRRGSTPPTRGTAVVVIRGLNWTRELKWRG